MNIQVKINEKIDTKADRYKSQKAIYQICFKILHGNTNLKSTLFHVLIFCSEPWK